MATYYSSHDAGGGGVGSIIDPFTLQELLDNTDAGDLGLVMATGTYAPTATIEVDNAGACTSSNYAVIRGANADGSDDGTVATISGANLIGTVDLLNANVAELVIKFEGLRFTGSKQDNFSIQTSVNAATIVFNSCRIDTANRHGIYSLETNASYVVNLMSCEIDHNGSVGLCASGIGRGDFCCYYCKIHHNTSDGVQITTGTYPKGELVACQVYKNGGNGITLNDGYFPNILNCTVSGNTSDGIEIISGSTASKIIICNNILRSNGGYGINTSTGASGLFTLCDYNCFSNNTSGDMDITTLGSHNITSDPKFVSESEGEEDYTLQSDSPCLNVGLGI